MNQPNASSTRLSLLRNSWCVYYFHEAINW